MKKFNSYDNVETYQDIEKLPAGGYIIGILDAEEKEESWGTVLVLKFDIAEGEFKNYYSNQYRNSQIENKKYKGVYRMNIPKEDGSEQDVWTARRFKTDIAAVELSNDGFHWDWDEKKLVGKLVGAVFFEKEYEFNSKTGMFTALHSLKNAEAIRTGKFKVPEPKMLKKAAANVFEDLPIDDGDLPF